MNDSAARIADRPARQLRRNVFHTAPRAGELSPSRERNGRRGLPANLSDVGSMISLAMNVIRQQGAAAR